MTCCECKYNIRVCGHPGRKEEKMYNKKISSMQVLIDAIKIYKSKIFLLLTPLLAYFIIEIIKDTSKFLIKDKSLYLRFFIETCFLILGQLFFTYGFIILIKLIVELNSKNNFIIKDFIVDGHNRFWKVFGVNLGWGLLLIVPILLAIMFRENPFFKINTITLKILWLIPIFLTIVICLRFVFAPISAVIEEKSIKSFSNSSNLLKGRFWRLLLGISIVFIIYFLPGGLDIFSGKVFSRNIRYIIDISKTIYNIFVFPFFYTYLTVLYINLKNTRLEETLKFESSYPSMDNMN